MSQHSFDGVLCYCIYCGCSLEKFYFDNISCDRIMEPVEQELEHEQFEDEQPA